MPFKTLSDRAYRKILSSQGHQWPNLLVKVISLPSILRKIPLLTIISIFSQFWTRRQEKIKCQPKSNKDLFKKTITLTHAQQTQRVCASQPPYRCKRKVSQERRRPQCSKMENNYFYLKFVQYHQIPVKSKHQFIKA